MVVWWCQIQWGHTCKINNLHHGYVYLILYIVENKGNIPEYTLAAYSAITLTDRSVSSILLYYIVYIY